MSDIRDVLSSVLKDAVKNQLKEEATALVVQETRDLSIEERLRRVEVETTINTAKIEVIETYLGHMVREYMALAEHTLDTSAAFLFLGVSKYLNRDPFTMDEINEILNDASERQAQSFGDAEPPEHYVLNFGPFVEDAIREFVAKKG
jgi:hypothetical protein